MKKSGVLKYMILIACGIPNIVSRMLEVDLFHILPYMTGREMSLRKFMGFILSL
jgi:hypothetical protein